MDPTSVSRCVAVAAHGKRCQQTPFRGGPYCWHHTQSRKVWAPSRPPRLTVAPAPERAAPAPPAVVPAVPPAERLARMLGPEGLAELARFLDSGGPGALRLEHRGPLVVATAEPAARPRRARRAAG